jgi:hypothetical protein
MDEDKRVIDLTLGELMKHLRELMPLPAITITEVPKKYVYGIKGIAELLHCSAATVHMYRRQGWIEPAIKQYGRRIVCDAELALELFGMQGEGRNK